VAAGREMPFQSYNGKLFSWTRRQKVNAEEKERRGKERVVGQIQFGKQARSDDSIIS